MVQFKLRAPKTIPSVGVYHFLVFTVATARQLARQIFDMA
jgi:hypothetical protein